MTRCLRGSYGIIVWPIPVAAEAGRFSDDRACPHHSRGRAVLSANDLAAKHSRYFFPKYPATAAQRNDINRDKHELNNWIGIHYEMAHQQRIILQRHRR